MRSNYCVLSCSLHLLPASWVQQTVLHTLNPCSPLLSSSSVTGTHNTSNSLFINIYFCIFRFLPITVAAHAQICRTSARIPLAASVVVWVYSVFVVLCAVSGLAADRAPPKKSCWPCIGSGMKRLPRPEKGLRGHNNNLIFSISNSTWQNKRSNF